MTTIVENKKIRLDVPYPDLSEVKRLGAKPYYKDGSFVCWYVPEGVDLARFRQWWSGKYIHEYNLKNGLAHSLADYLKFVSSVIRDEFKNSEWIVCNISDISIRNYASIEISDYDDSGKETAKARAVLYGKKMAILDKFLSVTGMRLSAGHKVMIKISPSFSEKYGMSYSIDDIKPEFTIGDMEAKLNKIRDSLKLQGLYDKNKSIPMKAYPSRVAVISPSNAAGLGDFMTVSKILDDNELCHFSYFSAFFQGDKIVDSFNDAIAKIKDSHEKTEFDLVCIIRGGGDKAGLNQINDLVVSTLVANLDIPVITGIGHEKDFTILDEVAHTRMPTPSMCVSYIKDLIFKDMEHTEKLISDTISVLDGIHEREELFIKSIQDQYEARIDAWVKTESSNLASVVNEFSFNLDLYFNNETSDIENMSAKFERDIENILELESREIKEIFNFVMANNPLAILERGYTVVKQQGKPIEKSTDIKSGEISITFQDKKINANIEVYNV